MFGFGRRQSKLRKEELREENGVLQERINSFRKEVRTLREELDSYKAREREIAEALNFARERASEYLKEARLRFALESARLNDFKLRISKRLERVGSAEKVGEELKECELFFAAAAKELEELAAGKRRKNTPEDEYRREIERLKELGSDRSDVHPVEEPQRSVPEFFPPAPAAPDKLNLETQETFRDKNRESVSVKTFPREALSSLKPVRSIFDRHPEPSSPAKAARLSDSDGDIVSRVMKYAESLGFREESASKEEIPGNDGEVLSATESREAVPPVQPKKVKMLSEDELTGLLAQITMESQREI